MEKVPKLIPSMQKEVKGHLGLQQWFQHPLWGQQERLEEVTPMENSAVIHCCLNTSPATRLSRGHLRWFLQWVWERGLGLASALYQALCLGVPQRTR